MGKHYRRVTGLVMLIFAAGLMVATICAAEEKNMKGWEIGSAYNSHYDVKEYEKFRAWVVGFKEESPMKGMSEATIVIVKDGEDLIDVHICPTWFAKPEDVGVKKAIGLKLKVFGPRSMKKMSLWHQRLKRGIFLNLKCA